jgi:hypothetical protein
MLGAIAGATVLMEVRTRWVGGAATGHLPLRPMALVAGACVMALLINPCGARLVYFPIEMQALWIRAMTFEWQSPFANPGGWGAVGGGRTIPIFPAFVVYLVLLIGVWLRAVTRWRTTTLVPVAVMTLWLGLGCWHLRAATDMALLTGPLVAAGLGWTWWRRTWPMLVGVGGTLVLAALALGVSMREPEWMCGGQPQCVTAAIERLGLQGRIFGHEWNHWLLYRFHPAITVTDHWEYVAGEEITKAIQTALSAGPEGLHEHLSHHQVDALILPLRYGTGIPCLQARGWAVVHLDDRFLIIVPQRPDTEALIQREGYHWLTRREMIPLNRAYAAHLLEETTRVVQHCPAVTWHWSYQSVALSILGRQEEANVASQQIPVRPPDALERGRIVDGTGILSRFRRALEP